MYTIEKSSRESNNAALSFLCPLKGTGRGQERDRANKAIKYKA
jgi:hypothetical protein